jgi:hypothetical protein
MVQNKSSSSAEGGTLRIGTQDETTQKVAFLPYKNIK